jgi:hypothetical protein
LLDPGCPVAAERFVCQQGPRHAGAARGRKHRGQCDAVLNGLVHSLRQVGQHRVRGVSEQRQPTRVAPISLLARHAAAAEPDAAEVWQQMNAERLCGMSHFAEQLRAKRLLRKGISVHKARDILWTYNSVEVYEVVGTAHGLTRDIRLMCAATVRTGVRPASAGLDVLHRSSWSSRSANRRNRCPTVDA